MRLCQSRETPQADNHEVPRDEELFSNDSEVEEDLLTDSVQPGRFKLRT